MHTCCCICLSFLFGWLSYVVQIFGGTSGSTLEIKGLKTTASAAILIAGTVGLNYLLNTQLKDRCTSFEPSASSWIPIRKDNGQPTSVTYSGTTLVKALDEADYSKLFSGKDLSLSKGGEVSNEKLVLGKLPQGKLKYSIFDDITFADPVRSNQIVDGSSSQVRGLPFKIKITCLKDKECADDKSPRLGYQLLKDNDEVIGKERLIDAHPFSKFQVFRLEDVWYFITVLDYCPDSSSCQSLLAQSPSARFLVGKIESCPAFRNLDPEHCIP